MVNVAVKPSAHDYKPGTKAGVKLKLTDLAGKPVVGSVVLAVYDKSVEYISGGSNIPEIREFFWNWRREHYPQTESSLAGYSEDLLKPHEVAMNGIGIFGDLMPGAGEGVFGEGVIRHECKGKNRRLVECWVGLAVRFFKRNNHPAFTQKAGVRMPGYGRQKHSLGPADRGDADWSAWTAAHSECHRRCERSPADFAQSICRHGLLGRAPRSRTSDGIVDVSVPIPENLTTWNIRGWALAPGVRVGQGEAEIVTTKNLLLRMQAPRFFVEQDEVVLSANVHNRLKTAKSVRVVLDLKGKSLTPLGETSRTVEIAAGGEARVDWRVKAVEHGEAVVRMQALTDEESDAMQMHFPVRVHGMLKTESYAGAIRPDRESASFTMTVPSKRRVNETLLEIRYSPTLAGAMVDALPYLISYPHDTTDCTLYRFLPTVITQNILKRMHLDLAAIKTKRTNLNAQEQGDAAKRATGWKRFEDNPVFDNAAVARMVKKGVNALTDMQLADGGWGWFSGWGEQSDELMTAQVVHGLQLAKQNGMALVPGVLERGIEWLKQYQARQLVRLKNGQLAKPVDPYKAHADNRDALVYSVLVEAKVNNQEMQDFLYRDRTELSVYAKGLFGLALSQIKAADRLAMIVRNIDQYLVSGRREPDGLAQVAGKVLCGGSGTTAKRKPTPTT